MYLTENMEACGKDSEIDKYIQKHYSHKYLNRILSGHGVIFGTKFYDKSLASRCMLAPLHRTTTLGDPL